MVTDELAHQIMAEMPETDASPAPDHMAFRVRDKKFALLWPGYVSLRVGYEEQTMLLASNRAKFTLSSPSGKGGWVKVKLLLTGEDEFRELVDKAWRTTAPPSLAITY